VVAGDTHRAISVVVAFAISPSSVWSQIVSAEECRQRVTGLGTEIATRKIPGVTVHSDACASANRNGVVTVVQP
jgi:hypothetical protein